MGRSRQELTGIRPADAAAAAAARQPHPSHPTLLYRLLKLTNLIGRPFFTHFAGRYDLTMNDLRVLMTLAPMGEAASHELAQVTGMHPMNVSRSVARLRRQGRVGERSDPLNRRRKILTPTAAGLELHEKLTPHVVVISEFLFDALSPLEAEFLSKLVDTLSRRLESVDPNSPLLIDSEALAKEAETPPPHVQARANGKHRKAKAPVDRDG